jgi:hypothetical protein
MFVRRRDVSMVGPEPIAVAFLPALISRTPLDGLLS